MHQRPPLPTGRWGFGLLRLCLAFLGRRSLEPPPDREQWPSVTTVLQLLLDLADQVSPLLIDGVLGVEQFSALRVAATFEVAELLLVGQLVLERLRKSGCPAQFSGLLVELEAFLVEETRVADVALPEPGAYFDLAERGQAGHVGSV